MPSTKYTGLSNPTHCLKRRGSTIGNNVLQYRTKQIIVFARRNFFLNLFATNKTKYIFRVLIVTQFIVKI